jgi:hypothetical protein
MLTNDELRYLGGLIDGEAYIGVKMYRASKHSFGYGVKPIFQIALGSPDSNYLKFLHKALRMGTIRPNQKSGLAWVVVNKAEVREILKLVKPYVKFPTTLTKIKLVLEFIDMMPNHRPLTREVWLKELEIIKKLREMSKRKLNRKKFDIDILLSEVQACRAHM